MRPPDLKRTLTFLCLCCLCIACRHEPTGKPAEGFITVSGKKLWYKVYGSGDATPLLMLHGGPGFPSYYLSPLAARLATERKVIVFDQIGCGRSERTTDTAFMSIESHLAQVDSLLSYLQVKEYYLYGHSYGTMLAMDHYLKHPQSIKGVVFASPCMSTLRWVKDADTLAGLLPDSTRLLLRQYLRKEKTDPVKFAKAIDTYYSTYYNRKQPVPKEVDSSIKNSGDNMYEHMWGKYDFECTGTLSAYNRINDLPRVKAPVLFTCGEFDAARPATVKYYHSLLPGSAFVVIPNAGHGTMGDQPGEDYKNVHLFLQRLDRQER